MGDFERTRIDVHPGNFWNGGFFEEAEEEFAFAAAKVEDGGWREGFDKVGDAIETDGVEGDLLLNFGFFGHFFWLLGFGSKSGEGFPRETTLMLKVAGDDPVTFGMVLKPVFAFAEELFNFLFTDPVVLLAVEDGDEDEEMLEEAR